MINKSAKETVTLALFTSVLCVSSFISIPVLGIPITMQSFAVAASLFCLGGCRTVVVLGAYILIGLIGLPVFSGFSCGVGALLGPSGGFIFGFLFEAVLYALITVVGKNKTIYKILGCITGQLSLYIIGSIWFWVFYSGTDNFFTVFFITVIPFLLPDAVKIILAFFISRKIKSIIKI